MLMNKTHKQIYKIFVDIIDQEMVNVAMAHDWLKQEPGIYRQTFNENFVWGLQKEINDKYFDFYTQMVLESDATNKFSMLEKISELKENPKEICDKYGGSIDMSKNWYSVGIGFMIACYLSNGILVPKTVSTRLQNHFNSSLRNALELNK